MQDLHTYALVLSHTTHTERFINSVTLVIDETREKA